MGISQKILHSFISTAEGHFVHVLATKQERQTKTEQLSLSEKQNTLFSFSELIYLFPHPMAAAAKSSSTDAEKAANGESPPERCPVEEVALVVPETDDPSLPVMTFRAWFLGIASCVLLIFLNTFFTFRTQPLTISAILMQIAVLPIGRFMAATLPTKEYGFLGSRFTFNPGPFNMKEHVIITIFANCGVSFGGGDAYSIGAITVMKAYYKQSLSFLCALFIVLTTQVSFPLLQILHLCCLLVLAIFFSLFFSCNYDLKKYTR